MMFLVWILLTISVFISVQVKCKPRSMMQSQSSIVGTNRGYPTQRMIEMFDADTDMYCTIDQHCLEGNVCIKPEDKDWDVGICTPEELQYIWIHHPMQWCTPGGRNAEKMGVITLETCLETCDGLCEAIEWWESDSSCFECTDPSLRKEFNNTDDLGYPPHVYIKGHHCHSSVTSCPELCASAQTDWNGETHDICDCSPGCQCPGDGWCVVIGPSLPRCGFSTCPEECTTGGMSWEGKTYQSCQCTDDLCYIGAGNEECQGAIEVSTNIPIQDTTLLTLSDASSAGLCPDWSSPELANGVWFKFVPRDTESYQVTTISTLTGYDTQIAVFSSYSGDCSTLECLQSNDDFGNLQSEIVFDAERGRTIYILVAGFSQAKGEFELLVVEYEDTTDQGSMLNPVIHKTTDDCHESDTDTNLNHFHVCVNDYEAVATAMCCSTKHDFCYWEAPCSGLVTYDEAKQFCVDLGDFRLCTREEIDTNECCDTPCFDNVQRIWSSEQCSDEQGIMEIVYESLGASQLGWEFVPDHCTLAGISCRNGRVTNIVLSDMKLPGTVPSELEYLVDLLELDLSDNVLVGLVPKELGKLTNLVRLHLSGNQLFGSIPWEFGNFPRLTELSLSDNELLGSIPCELGKLRNLVKLFLSGNKLSGTIPMHLSNLKVLVELDLSNNDLSGSNPNELGNLANLTRLSLRDNKLASSIPAEFGNFANIIELDLSYNELSGQIPNNLGNLGTINNLDLSNNGLSEEIPSELGNLEHVDEINLSNNKLSGGIPKELGNPRNLALLYLSHNQLTGPIPSELGALPNLVELHVSFNELSGDVPSELGNPQRLALLNTDGNDALGMFAEMRCCFEIHHHYRKSKEPKLVGGSSGAGRLVHQYQVQNHEEVISVDIAINDGDRVCKYLGFRKAVVIFEGTPYGTGTEPYYVQKIQNGSVFTTGSYEAISLICDTGIAAGVFIGPAVVFFILMVAVLANKEKESKASTTSKSKRKRKKSDTPLIPPKSFLWKSGRAIVICVMTSDVILNILVAIQLYGTGQNFWFSISVTILIISSVLLALSFYSGRYYRLKVHEIILLCVFGHAIPVILFLDQLLSPRKRPRYQSWSNAARSGVGIPAEEHCTTRLTKFVQDQMGIVFKFAIIQRISETIPQMMLQLSIITANGGITALQIVCLWASLISISAASVLFAWCLDNAAAFFLLLCSWSDVLLLALVACMLTAHTSISQDVFFMARPVPLLMTVWAYTAFAVFLVMMATSFYKFRKVKTRWSAHFVGVWSYFRVIPIFFYSILTGFITMLVAMLLNFSFFVLEHIRLDKTCFTPDDLSTFRNRTSCFSLNYLSAPFKQEDDTSEEYGSVKCISVVVRWNLGLLFRSKNTAILFTVFKLYLCLMIYLTYFYEHPSFGLHQLGTVVDGVAYTSLILTLLTIVWFPRFAKYRHFIIKKQPCNAADPSLEKEMKASHIAMIPNIDVVV